MPLSLFTSAFLPQERVHSLTGTVETIANFESKTLGNQRNLSVYLPPNYAAATDKRYPVLYMHDGQNVFDGFTSYIPNQEWRADEAAEALIQSGLIEPIMIVGIDNAGMERANEYLPTKFKMGNSEIGGKANLYGKMLTDEIMPMINAKYRTKTGAANTALLGSSFGGVITCVLGASRPDVFGKLGIVSPSVWVNNRELLNIVKAPSRGQRRAKVWIDMGTKEGAGSVKNATDLFDTYVRNGWRPQSEVVCVIEANAEHNELAWSRRMMSILTFLFKK